jgi:transposase
MRSIHRGVPAGLEEIAQLGRTLWRRREDILAFFDHHASNGPTEAKRSTAVWEHCAATH